ncbi:MAG: sugar biosynthesis protein [Desulfobacula sp.]|jgi:heme oxygenase (mycobilin-producing)|uniref:antibiotic biosynthesis monooxygenase family protein n=1 Tax=Desulfobacula sp. TaxID=2593537 RepID=UPI001E03695C|nr:sugar biosynthesis protein [Desulfobacula sp.]MBT4027730.1 sugar biosynthesis protein [Desulfobacula sp.]MBT4199924.1 sugar biosynthesis protein [Desulfobacula sp.]MBT4508796.1 sugar biosynthesis protein [Desulfobacula sp.]MBT4875052.1 sugar biosynthesis protein [Desulfobacula sp.]
MSIAVLIIRQYKQGEIEVREANKINLQLRALATVQPGFISGQSMFSQDNPNKIIILSKWNGREDWETWKDTASRKEFYKKIEKFLEYPEKIEVFSF